MTTDTPSAVQAAANRLMNALALHEDSRDTVTDALHDMFDTAREEAPTAHSEADAAGWDDAPAFLVTGGRRGDGHYAVINVADPAHRARPVTRAYGHPVSEDYTSFAAAEDMRVMLNRAWSLDGGHGADIQTAGPAHAGRDGEQD